MRAAMLSGIPVRNKTAAAYTDEQAQDAVGTILTNSATVSFTYNDATPSITASVIAGGGLDTTAFHNGGDSFGGAAVIGTNDGFSLAFETGGTQRGMFSAAGEFFVGATAALSSDQWLFRKDQNSSSFLGIANKDAGASALVAIQLHNNTADAASIFLTSSAYPSTAESGPDELVIEHGAVRIGAIGGGTYRVKTGGAVRHTVLSSGETLIGTATAFGGELVTFRKDGIGSNTIYFANLTGGVASQTQFSFVNDGGTHRGGISVTATGFTPASGYVANAVHLAAASAAASLELFHQGTGPVVIKGNGTNEIARFLNDGASKLSFYGVTAVARAAAYTQTYATAARTQNNLTGVDLTDNSTGTASDTIADAGVLYVQATENDFRASIARAVDRLLVDITNVKQVVNAIIDDSQGYGLAA